MNRNEALEALITSRPVWPKSLDEAYNPQPKGCPSLTDSWFWSEGVACEILLASDDFDLITEGEFKEARERAINKPAKWPENANMLVQNGDGCWVFGTWIDAAPLGGDIWHGTKRPTEKPGTWFLRSEGRADIAGWDWAQSIEYRTEEPKVSSPEEEEAFKECERRLNDGLLSKDMEQVTDISTIPMGYPKPSAPSNGSEWGHAAIAMAKHVARQNQMNQRATDQLATVRDKKAEDPGGHYRHQLRITLTDNDIARGYAEVKLDPYRICALYSTGGGPREHIVKKGLRGESKGQTERDVIKEMRSALDRWEEMLDENERIS